MLTQKVWLSCDYHTVSSGRDTLVYSNDLYNYAYEKANSSRMSVDGGRLTPGVFRINPYDISKMSLVTHGQQTIKNVFYGSDTGTFYKYHVVTGKLPLCIPITEFIHPTLAQLPAGTEDILLQKATAKVGGSILDMGTELGELRETLQMLRSPFKSLRSFMLDKNNRNLTRMGAVVRKLRGKGTGVQTGKLMLDGGITVADAWLELRYGLRPLVSSILDIAEEVQRKKKVFLADKIKSKKADFLIVNPISVAEDVSLGGISTNLRGTLVQDGSSSVQCRAQVYYKRTREDGALEKYGLALKFIPEITWELTRGSFVVDWIFSIGPWLGTCRIDPSVQILGNTVSTRTSVDCNSRFEKPYNTMGNQVELEGISYVKLEIESFSRQCNRDLPNYPLYKGNEYLTIAKSVDMLALILQPVMKGLRRELTKR